jgi:cytidine diphosphoramidate kinase
MTTYLYDTMVRKIMNNQAGLQGNVYWITGVSGAGKTTLGTRLHAHLKNAKKSVLLLDGDALREMFGNDLGHTRDDRFKSAMRNARLCEFLSGQGVDVICCTISLFHKVQKWNREHIPNYREILVQAPIEIVQKRDPKKIYRDAAKTTEKNIVGIDIKEEFPEKPDLVLVNDGSVSADTLFQQLIEAVSAWESAPQTKKGIRHAAG